MRNKLIMLVTAAAFAVALAVPAASAAATCPPGQTGTPPYCETPEEVSITEVVHDDNGVVELTLFFAKPGTLNVSGKVIRGLQLTVTTPGAVTIKLRLNHSKVAQHFSRKGWTRPKRVVITFTATDGTTTTKKKGIVFKK